MAENDQHDEDSLRLCKPIAGGLTSSICYLGHIWTSDWNPVGLISSGNGLNGSGMPAIVSKETRVR